MKFGGTRVPVGEKIVQSSNPFLHGLGYRLKQQLLRVKPVGLQLK
jgi:hypothetical protein